MNNETKPTVGIIGFGRFGQFWARLLSQHFEVVVYDRSNKLSVAQKMNVELVSLAEACRRDVVFYAVSIAALGEMVQKTAEYLKPGATVLDVASVKMHAKQVFEKYITDKQVNTILTHPMFGPDSAREGVRGLPIVMHNLRSSQEAFGFWKSFFSGLGMRVELMSPEAHDHAAAYSQGVTHVVGRVLDELHLASTPIDTAGFAALLKVREQTCNDTWDLFSGLQGYNPYTADMRMKLREAFDAINHKLIPEQKKEGTLTIGIQGGKGSFNEEACKQHCERIGITQYELVYLYTSENVLKALTRGDIDVGQCATQNSIGGVVRETLHALSKYQCAITEEFEFVVNHCLLARPGVSVDTITTIMSHPQALAQCQKTLPEKFPGKELIAGTGELIDQSHAAEYLSKGELPETTAVLASKVCSGLYGLDILAEGLQDRKDNYTSFVWMKRT